MISRSEGLLDGSLRQQKKKKKIIQKPEKVIPTKKTSFAEVFEASKTKLAATDSDEEKRQRLLKMFGGSGSQQPNENQQQTQHIETYHQKAKNNHIRSLFAHRKSGGGGSDPVDETTQDIGGAQGSGISDTHETGYNSEHKPAAEWIVEGNSDTTKDVEGKKDEQKPIQVTGLQGEDAKPAGSNLFLESKAEKEEVSEIAGFPASDTASEIQGLVDEEEEKSPDPDEPVHVSSHNIRKGDFSFVESQQEKENAQQIAGIEVEDLEGQLEKDFDDEESQPLPVSSGDPVQGDPFDDESRPVQVSSGQAGSEANGDFAFVESQQEKDNAEKIAGIEVEDVEGKIEEDVETQEEGKLEDAEEVSGIPAAASSSEVVVAGEKNIIDEASNNKESDPVVEVQGLDDAKPAPGQFDFLVSENEKQEVVEVSGIPASDVATNIKEYVDSEPVQVTGLTKGKTETGITSQMVDVSQEKEEVDEIAGFPASDTAEKLDSYVNDNAEPVQVTGITKAHKETGAGVAMVSNEEKDEIVDMAGIPASETANELEAYANDQPVHVDGLSTVQETGKFDYLVSNQEKEEVETISGFPASDTAGDLDQYAIQGQGPVDVDGLTKAHTTGKFDYLVSNQEKEEVETVSGFPASDTAGDLDEYAVQAQGPVEVDGLTKAHKESGAFSEVMSEEQKTTVTKVSGFPASKTAGELTDYANDHPAEVSGLSSATKTGDFDYLLSDQEKQEVQDVSAFPASETASKVEGYADDQPVHVSGGGKEESGEFSYLVSNQEKQDAENLAGMPASETASELEEYAQSQPVEVTGLTKAHKETGAVSSMYGEAEQKEAQEFAAFPASDVASELEDYAKSQPVEVTGLTKAHKETGAVSSMFGDAEKEEADTFAAFPASDVATNVEDYAKSQPTTVQGLDDAKATGKFDYLVSEQEKEEVQDVAGFPAVSSANKIQDFADEVQTSGAENMYGDAMNDGSNPQDLGGVRTYGVYVPEPAAKAASGVDHAVYGKGGSNENNPQASDSTPATNVVAEQHIEQGQLESGAVTQDGNLFKDAKGSDGTTQSTPQYDFEPVKHDGNLFGDAKGSDGTTQSTPQYDYEPVKHDGNLFSDAKSAPQYSYQAVKHESEMNVQNANGNLFNDAQGGTQSTQQQEQEHGQDVQNKGGQGNLFSSAQGSYTATDGKETSSKPAYVPGMLSMWDEWWTKPFCDDDELEIQMFLETDTWSDLEAGMLVYELTSSEITFIEPGDIPSDTVVNDQVCTLYDACYEFYFFDTWGDGFITGGLYLNAGGVNVLDIRPQSEGHFDSLQFWGVYFGGACEDIYGSVFGVLESINEDIVINMTTHNVDPAPLFIDETSESCGIGTDTILVEMDFTVDEYSIFDNGVALHDVNASGFFWYYEEGSFVEAAGTEYIWTRCVDAFACNEFLLYDAFGNGVFTGAGSLSLLVNGEEALLVEANEATTAHTTSPHPDAILYSVLIGNCPDDYGNDFTT